MRAIQHANTICDWKENLTEEEMPPQWMWTIDQELYDWLEDVMRSRKEKFSTDNDDSESSPMISNEYARDRR